MMMMNCFCGMVDQQKAFSLISSRDHCQRFSPLRISDMPRAGFEPAQNLSSGLVKWSCAVVITTTPQCHYTAAFSRKGRFCPLQTLEKDKTAQTVFEDMGFSDGIQEEFKVIEKFTCTLYRHPKFNSVNEVRLELFLKKYQPKKKEVVISCIKKMEGSFLPLYASVLQQKTNRTNHKSQGNRFHHGQVTHQYQTLWTVAGN